jgi:hypothetical protein
VIHNEWDGFRFPVIHGVKALQLVYKVDGFCKKSDATFGRLDWRGLAVRLFTAQIIAEQSCEDLLGVRPG